MAALSTVKQPTNVSLDTMLVAEAKTFGLNVPQASERGLRTEVAAARTAAWLAALAGVRL